MTYDCFSAPRDIVTMKICQSCEDVMLEAGLDVKSRSRDGMGNCEICLRRTLVHEAEVRKERGK